MEGLFRKFAFCLTAVAFAAGTACSDDNTNPIIPGPGPDPEPDPEYAIDIKATSAMVEYGGELGESQHGYFLALGDVKLESVDPSTSGAGNVVLFEIYSSTGEANMIPAATYEFQEASDTEEPVPPCFIGATSGYIVTNAAGEASDPETFASGAVTVSGSGSSYTIEVIGTFPDGRKLRFTYTGAIEFVEGGGGDPEIAQLEEDVNTPFVKAIAEYYGVTEDTQAGSYGLFLYSGKTEGQGSNLYPAELGGYMLQIRLFTTVPEEEAAPAIVAGTYTVSSDGAAGTWLKGYVNTDVYWADGTFIEKRTEESGLCGLAATGTIVVALSGEEYTVTVDLTSDLGYKIAGTYTGSIQMFDKSYSSNITSDYTPNIAGLPGQAYYYGDYYDVGGNNWLVLIGNFKDATDAVQLDLITPIEFGFSQGLPVGVYTIGRNYDEGTYAAVYGFLNGSTLIGTWFMSDIRDSSPWLHAPAKEGTVTVAKSGDDYTLSFDFIDDSPEKHRVMGDWTGSLNLVDDSSAVGAPAKIQHKAAAVKTLADDALKAATKAPKRHGASRWSVNR